MAIANDEQDLVSYVYRGESHILGGNADAGRRDLESVLQLGGGQDVSPWVQRSRLLLGLHQQRR